MSNTLLLISLTPLNLLATLKPPCVNDAVRLLMNVSPLGGLIHLVWRVVAMIFGNISSVRNPLCKFQEIFLPTVNAVQSPMHNI